MLTTAGIAHYLLSLGVVNPSAVVEDELAVLDVSRRNAVFLAAARSGPAYVVKQARAETAATLAHEAAMLRALAAMPELDGLVPQVVHEDREAACLVLRTPADARDWSEHHRAGRFPRSLARALGRTPCGAARAACRGHRGPAARHRPAVGADAARALARAAARPQRRGHGPPGSRAGQRLHMRPAAELAGRHLRRRDRPR